ncbi:MAG: radical SAM protein, partial [Candidatus Handelsmanbacteria bacterium RIFCSPLOWO2_12_FULL_64_10]
MKALLISTYELGRQPFGLASPAAYLRRDGVDVTCADLSVDPFPVEAAAAADLVAFYVPMHTATRLTAPLLRRVKALNPAATLCCYGLYAPVNEPYLRGLGADAILGGEFEEGLAGLCRRLREQGPSPQTEPVISLRRQRFLVPDRLGLPPLSRYAQLCANDRPPRVVGYVEASRGCKHLCRHCPVVPVYGGKFRVVQPGVVLRDIRQQVEAGATHITFGDPDFFNGIGHALPLVRALHREHPGVSYDVTVKIEHLLRHADALPVLCDTGCALVTTAVEAIDDRILAILDKGHTREDFIEVVRLFRENGLVLNPTFIPFTPWTSL